MNLYQLEYAAQILFKMLENHPEICPHDYEWIGSLTKDGIKIESYRCQICGKTITKEKQL